MPAQRRITPAILAAWTGTDAELARHIGVTPQAVAWARRNPPRPPKPKPLGGRVKRAVLAEAARRGVSVLHVLEECRVALVPDYEPDTVNGMLLAALQRLDTLMDFGDNLDAFTAITYDDTSEINAAFQQAREAIAAAKALVGPPEGTGQALALVGQLEWARSRISSLEAELETCRMSRSYGTMRSKRYAPSSKGLKED